MHDENRDEVEVTSAVATAADIVGGSVLRRLLPVALCCGLLLSVTPALADLTMTCKNPRQDYLVRISEKQRRLQADDTRYKVLAVERATAGPVVAGLTVNNGPTFRTYFGPKARMELYADSKLFQTDKCRAP